MTEDDLRALAALAAKIGKPEYSIACSHGPSRQFPSVDDLMEFDNSPSRSIIRFTVSASAADSLLNLAFGNEPFTNLQIHLAGSEPAKLQPSALQIIDIVANFPEAESA